MLRAKGFATEEIPGGCFCCRFNSLVDAADKLTQESRPEVFIAEPVGSCTDLVATVNYPLRRMYGDDYLVAPLSVLVDPVRARRVMGLDSGGSFSEKVIYIYRKQLEEADLIVINKVDLLPEAQIQELAARLTEDYPHARILCVSSRTGAGLQTWFDCMTTGEQSQRPTMPIDYDIYADGEALLGWLNATIMVRHDDAFEAEPLLRSLCTELQQRLRQHDAEVAHLKMTYSPDESLSGEVAAINLVRNDFVPELGMALEEESSSGQIIVNLRAELDPDRLATALHESVIGLAKSYPGLSARVEHLEHFKPGRPTPTHGR
jgi:G3E family GTPase